MPVVPACGVEPSHMANVSLDRVVGHVPRLAAPHSQQFMNLVRLTDLAALRYEAARASVEIYRAEGTNGRVSAFYEAINNFEHAVDATHRAVLNVTALSAATRRKLPAATPRQEANLRLVRNQIMHMDEKLARGESELHVLFPVERGLIIGPRRLSYRDLVSCITKCSRAVEVIRKTSP